MVAFGNVLVRCDLQSVLSVATLAIQNNYKNTCGIIRKLSSRTKRKRIVPKGFSKKRSVNYRHYERCTYLMDRGFVNLKCYR